MNKNLILVFSFLFLGLFFATNLFAFDVPVTFKITGDYDYTTEMCSSNDCVVALSVNGTNVSLANGVALSDEGLATYLRDGFFVGPFNKSDLSSTSQSIPINVTVGPETNSGLIGVNLTVPNPNYYAASKKLTADNVVYSSITNQSLTANAVTFGNIVVSNKSVCAVGQVLKLVADSDVTGSITFQCADDLLGSDSGSILEAGDGILLESMSSGPAPGKRNFCKKRMGM